MSDVLVEAIHSLRAAYPVSFRKLSDIELGVIGSFFVESERARAGGEK